jgi:hypothetical protein
MLRASDTSAMDTLLAFLGLKSALSAMPSVSTQVNRRSKPSCHVRYSAMCGVGHSHSVQRIRAFRLFLLSHVSDLKAHQAGVSAACNSQTSMKAAISVDVLPIRSRSQVLRTARANWNNGCRRAHGSHT